MQCKLCNSSNVRYLFKSYNTHGRHIIDRYSSYKLYKCLDCQVVFIGDINIDDNYYAKNYDSGYYVNNKRNHFIHNFISESLLKFFTKNKEKTILNYFAINDKLSILDVGCGDGTFLSILDKKKFDVYGVEINPDGAKKCKEKEIKIYCQDIINIDFTGKQFDVITLNHVLEHFKDPIQIIKKIGCLLKNNGILLISTPTTDSFGFRFGDKNWYHLDSPRHLILYNKKSLEKLSELTGIKIIKIKNELFEFPLDMFWSLRNYFVNIILLPFCPIMKIFMPETITIICKKTLNKKY